MERDARGERERKEQRVSYCGSCGHAEGRTAAVIYRLIQRGTLVGLDGSSGPAEQEVGSALPTATLRAIMTSGAARRFPSV